VANEEHGPTKLYRTRVLYNFFPLYLPCNHSSLPTFMTALTLAMSSLNNGSLSNVTTCDLMPTNLNYSLTDPLKYKRMTRSIYIFTATKESMSDCITIH
jgi:hypothetical protein